MIEGQKALIKIIKDAISDYDFQLEKLDGTRRNYALMKNKELFTKSQSDLKEIVNLDQEELVSILMELQLSEKVKEKIYNMVSHIQILLKSNIENGTTFKISEEQLDYINKFLAYVAELIKQIEARKNKNKKEITELTEKSNKYHAFLKILEDQNNETFIEDTELLTLIFKEREVAEATQRNILLDLMRYNKSLYQRKLNDAG